MKNHTCTHNYSLKSQITAHIFVLQMFFSFSSHTQTNTNVHFVFQNNRYEPTEMRAYVYASTVLEKKESILVQLEYDAYRIFECRQNISIRVLFLLSRSFSPFHLSMPEFGGWCFFFLCISKECTLFQMPWHYSQMALKSHKFIDHWRWIFLEIYKALILRAIRTQATYCSQPSKMCVKWFVVFSIFFPGQINNQWVGSKTFAHVLFFVSYFCLHLSPSPPLSLSHPLDSLF